jgi:hypothetical protein
LTVLEYVNFNSPFLTNGDLYNSTIQDLAHVNELDLGWVVDLDGDQVELSLETIPRSSFF